MPSRASKQRIAKRIVIKGWGCRSGESVRKEIELTLGDLYRVSNSRLSQSRGWMTAIQKSAEGVVGSNAEGLNGARKGLMEGKVGRKSNEQKAAENPEWDLQRDAER